ncbi:type II toxin-antitoxin system HicA family toxin [Candidatus Poriferisodalis sp.]|uniref:type II toxin-antitoxin system HicA family toxin n=1 Tax=Candidatus Poriferisodalis sp. TaxID=3101277 RepID=UPI003B523375
MKRAELVRRIRSTGSILVRHGAKHDWYRNPETGEYQAVPRHNEINERLARRIIKQLSPPSD